MHRIFPEASPILNAQLAAARRQCWELEESLDQLEATRQAELRQMQSSVAE